MANPRDTIQRVDNQNLSDSSSKGGVVGSLGKMAGTMLAFQVGVGIYKAVTGKLNTGIGSIFKTLSSVPGARSRIISSAPTGSAKGMLRQLFNASTTQKPNTTRTFTSLLQRTNIFQKSKVGGFFTRMNELENTALHSKSASLRLKQNPIFGPAKEGYKRGQAGFRQAMASRAWRLTKDNAAIMPLFYASHRMSTRNQPNRKAWYNPLEIAKFSGSFLTTSAMFGGAAPLLKGIGKSTTVQNALTGFTQRYGKSIETSIGKAMEFADRHRGTRMAAGLAAMTEIRSTTKPRSADTGANFFSRMMKSVPRFKQAYGANKIRAREAATRTVGENEFAYNLIQSAEDSGKNTAAAEFMKKNLAKDVMGKPDNIIMRTLNRVIGHKAIQSDTFRDSLGNDLKRGRGMVTFNGKAMDISTYMPSTIFRTALNIARIPRVLGHSPVDIMNIGSLSDWSLSKSQSYKMIGGYGHSVNLGHSYDHYGQMVNAIQSSDDAAMANVARRRQYFGQDTTISQQATLQQHRIDTRMKKASIEKGEKISFDDTMKEFMNARHGRMELTKHQNVYNIKGRLYLENNMEAITKAADLPKGVEIPSDFFELGINTRTGNAMRYRSIPIRSGGVFSKVHDRYMGGSVYADSSGDTKHAGYNIDTPVQESPSTGAIGKFRHMMASKFDIGGKDHPTIFGRIGAWFRSFSDPLEPRVATSKINMRDPEIAGMYAGAKNPSDIRRIGQMFGKTLDKVRTYAYQQAFGDEDDLKIASEFLRNRTTTSPSAKKDPTKGLLNYLLVPSELREMNDIGYQKFMEQLGSLPAETVGSSRGIMGAQSVMREIGQGITGRSVHDVSHKVGAATISYADEFNMSILSQALKHLSVKETAELAGKLSNRNALQSLRALQEMSAGTKSPFSTLFDSINPDNIQAKSRMLGKMMDLVRSNQDMVDEAVKHTNPMYKMGNHRKSEYFSSYGNANPARTRLLIADKVDVAGMPVNSGLFRGISPGVNQQLRDGQGRLAMDTMTIGGMATGAAIDSINNVANAVGLGFTSENARTIGMFGKNMLTKRVLPLMGAMYAWQAADGIVDESGLFDNTGLGEGLNVFMASQLMRARLAAARVMDITGVTSLAKKSEDVMPGSISSPFAGAVRGIGAPLAGASLGMTLAGPAGGLVGGIIGAGIGLLTAGGPLATLGGYDITKSRKELIEEYSGRSKVAYKGDRGWLLGSTPMRGTDVDAFVPNWYARMRSGYRHTPTLYGSKVERMTSYLDPGHYSEKNYNSRPYPSTGGAFANTPLVSNILSFGNRSLHESELEGLRNLPGGNAASIGMNNLPAAMQGTSAYALNNGGSSDFIGGTTTLQKAAPVSPGSINARIQSLYYSGTEFAGLRGFMGQALLDKATGGNVPGADVPVYESAAFMSSAGRFYWEQGLGDLMGTTEFLRRFFPRKNTDTDYYNPLPNLMPEWLPAKFRKGDPYTKQPLGEIRLPGAGYESANDVELTFPGEVSVVGASVEETVANYLFGSRKSAHLAEIENRTKAQIAQSLSGANGTAKLDTAFFDPRLNLSGRSDVYSNGISYKIKALDDKHYRRVDSITPDMESQLSLLNGLSKGSSGMAIYVNAQTGETKEFQVASDKNKFIQSVEMLQAARQEAERLSHDKSMQPNMNLANAYSRMDRLKILADVAPQSSEFFSTFKEVQGLSKFQNIYNYEVDMENVQKQQFIRSQPKELYPYRFSKTATETNTLLSQKNAVSSEYGFISKKLGAAWEMFSHMNTPIHRKFLDINSPYEAYDRTQVHGKEIKLWNHPYQHFIRPYMSTMSSRDEIGQNMQSGAFGGFLFGGPVGAVLGAGAAGAVAGFNSITGRDYAIPGWRQKQRDIEGVLDKVEYDRAMQQYQMTGDKSYLDKATMTMTYFNKNIDQLDVSAMKKAAPFAEKKYLMPMLATANQEERTAILNTVPDALKSGINRYWNAGLSDKIETENETVRQQYNSLDPSWAGFNPAAKMDLIKTKILKSEGLDARDAGVGWHSHVSELGRSALIPSSFESNMKIDVGGIQSGLQKSLSSLGQVSVSVSPTLTESIMVNLTVVGG